MTMTMDMRDTRHSSGPIWGLAALAAIVVHVAVALTFLSAQPDSSEETFGATALEVGLDIGAPIEDISDLPPGPETAAALASTAAMEQAPQADAAVVEPIKPLPSDIAELAARPDAADKPITENHDKSAVRQTAAQNSVAAEAMATPSQNAAPPAPRSVAPAPGNKAGDRRVRAAWQNALLAHLEKHKRYPASRLQKDVDIVVRFSIDRDGHVLSAEIMKSSGDPAFDTAAIAMLHRADPVPLPPPAVAGGGLSFNLPVSFRVGS